MAFEPKGLSMFPGSRGAAGLMIYTNPGDVLSRTTVGGIQYPGYFDIVEGGPGVKLTREQVRNNSAARGMLAFVKNQRFNESSGVPMLLYGSDGMEMNVILINNTTNKLFFNDQPGWQIT